MIDKLKFIKPEGDFEDPLITQSNPVLDKVMELFRKSRENI